MAAIPFQIEIVEPVRGFVIARQLEPTRFRLAPGSALGGCPVSAMTQPPSRNPDTALRDDLFVFQMRRPGDAGQLKVGAIVELTEWRVPAG